VKEGAYEYLVKPVDAEELLRHVGRIAERRALRAELEEARAERLVDSGGAALVGRSAALRHLIGRVDALAQAESPVLVTGESGTGKELVARALHERSARRAGPFIAINCAAFPEGLLEAELFGHERGAFTGAVRKRDGRFKAADGGTLLLDEIAEMPLSAQAKLLRVLQEGTIEPLGTNAAVRIDVRVVSATHRNLKERIAQGLFREDLYYRLNVLPISICPLRDRREDLPLLIEHFLRRDGRSEEPVPTLSPSAWAALLEYAFPGNVRELEHAVAHARVLARGKREIDLEDLPEDIAGAASLESSASASTPPEEPPAIRPLGEALHEFEREYLRRALHLTEGRRMRAASLLGISRRNLWAKLKQHGLDSEDD
jgi:DNA-binding NtrC family response regulator